MLGGNASQVLASLDGIAYLSDLEGVILAYGGQDWASFAERNGAPELLEADRIIGANLFDFIRGDKVRGFYRKRMDELRDGDETAIVVPTRCDAPTQKRELRLAMTPFRGEDRVKGVLFQSTLLSFEERPPIALYDFQSVNAFMAKHRSLPIVAMCSLCQKVRSPGSGPRDWISSEQYYRDGGSSVVRISHGVCEPCAEGHYGRGLGG